MEALLHKAILFHDRKIMLAYVKRSSFWGSVPIKSDGMCLRCPFCAIDFDVVGRKETFEKDMKFILKTARLDVRILRRHMFKPVVLNFS